MSRINKKVLKKLAMEGVEADTHHATVRKAFASVTGDNAKLSKEEIAEIRAGLSAPAKNGAKAEAKEKAPAKSREELLAEAQAFVDKQRRTKGPEAEQYKRVVEVLEPTPAGRPAVVTVQCVDPQVDGEGNSVCGETREIKIQDLFQVTRCHPCQKRSVQIYRNELARRRRAELRRHREAAAK